MSQVDQHLMALDVSSLPGVGWSTRQKLHSMNIEVVADVRQQNEAELQKELGAKNGSAVWLSSYHSPSKSAASQFRDFAQISLTLSHFSWSQRTMIFPWKACAKESLQYPQETLKISLAHSRQ